MPRARPAPTCWWCPAPIPCCSRPSGSRRATRMARAARSPPRSRRGWRGAWRCDAAVRAAHRYLQRAIAGGRQAVRRPAGHGPVHHFHASARMVACTSSAPASPGSASRPRSRARGGEVRLVDRGGGPGPHGCSWWAGGMLAPFCEGERAEEPVARLGQQAADWWERHAGGVSPAGTLVVALGARPGGARPLRAPDAGARDAWAPTGSPSSSPTWPGASARALFFARRGASRPAAGARRRLAERLAGQGIAVETEVAPEAATRRGGPDRHRLPRPRRAATRCATCAASRARWSCCAARR